jgi:hypothetical protein
MYCKQLYILFFPLVTSLTVPLTSLTVPLTSLTVPLKTKSRKGFRVEYCFKRMQLCGFYISFSSLFMEGREIA